MINQLLDILKQAGLHLNAEEIADILWLALQIQPSQAEPRSHTPSPVSPQEFSPPPDSPPTNQPLQPRFNLHKTLPLPVKQLAADAPLYARTIGASAEVPGGIIFKTPSAAALPESLQVAKSLKPFMRRVASHTETVLDEVATAERIAEEKIPVPVLRPAPERWFDLVLIVDNSPSMGIWQRTVIELQKLLEQHGAFRNVQTWGLLMSENGQICLRSGVGVAARSRRLHSPNELVDPGNQRLFLVVSDCVSSMWQDGTITTALAPWVKTGPLAIVQMLPERLWERTALGLSAAVRFRALSPGVPNQKLIVEELAVWDDDVILEAGLKVPVFTLEPEPLSAWSKMVVGVANATSPGFILEPPEATELVQPNQPSVQQEPAAGSAERIVHRFLNTASPVARKLAGLLAAAPVISLPIVRLLRKTMLEQLRQVHIAEVFLGSILKATSPIDAHTDPDYVQYDFIDPEVRSLLLDASPLSKSTQVVNEVSSFIAERAGLSLHEFWATLEDPTLAKTEATGQQVQPFARVTAQVLRRLGGDYVQMAERMERQFEQEDVDATSTPPRYERVVTPIGGPFLGHESAVTSVAFSPDGRTIVSSSDDKTVRLWDLQGNPIGQPFHGHQDWVNSVAFSPDGRVIASGSRDKTVRLWDLQGNPIGQPFHGHQDRISSIAFGNIWTISPDLPTVIASGSGDSTVRRWDLQGNPIGQPFHGHEARVTSVAFSPDGAIIASGSDDRTVRLWDTHGNPIGQPFHGHTDSIYSVAFSPDGAIIASGSRDGTVRLWNLQGELLCEPLRGHQGEVWTVTFSPDGRRIASGSSDKTVRLWSVQVNDDKFTSPVLMQYFHWYTPADGNHWNTLKQNARELSQAGITALWLPPACKASGGGYDVGYGIYDLFDLGEFDQKGSTRTKYGTKDEYISAIKAAQAVGIQVYADAVFNHKNGGDQEEEFDAYPVASDNRNNLIGNLERIKVWTNFTFPGRGDKYSSMKWHWWHFSSVNHNMYKPGDNTIYRFKDKQFATSVDPRLGNYDFLMACDLDMGVDQVRGELKYWGEWFYDITNIDGFRLDAVKHIDTEFFNEWLDGMKNYTQRSLFAVGEYWTDDVEALHWFLGKTDGRMALFDVPLHYNLHRASRAGGSYDMRTILDKTLMKTQPSFAVTFVDDHNSQPLQALESVVESWFKPLAYALILLRREGYPCVFYADYYGAHYRDRGRDGKEYEIYMDSHRWLIDKLLYARQYYAYGVQRDYFDHPDVIGWTFSGDENHSSAMAVLMSDGPGGSKWMETGKPNAIFLDLLEHIKDPVQTNEQGWGEFHCEGGSVSVWLMQS